MPYGWSLAARTSRLEAWGERVSALMHATLSPLLRLPARLGARWLLVTIWTVAGVVGVAQRWADRAFAGAANDVWAVALDVSLIVLWAAATPAILRSSRRRPVRGPEALQHAAIHLAVAVAFIVATNVAIRAPMLWSSGSADIGALGRDLAMGLVHFGPTALLVYAAIVAVGHLRWPVDTAPPPAATYPERIAVREWNRSRLVRAADVEWIESDDNYVIVQVSGRTFKGRGRISELETQLDPSHFVRIHRSAIVAVTSVREVQPRAKGDLAVVMNDGKQLRVARTRRNTLEARLGGRIS